MNRLRHGWAWAAHHPFTLLLGATLIALAAVSVQVGWMNAWLSPDQRGQWLMREARYTDAAAAFADPLWRGIALMKAGSFKEAAAGFAGIDTAEAAYDQGNALVMLGKYEDAVGRYDRALALRPSWADARANRKLAQARAERLKLTGGDETGGQTKPDEVVFDKNKKPGTEGEKDQSGQGEMSDAAIRASWLKRVQTQPADFLRAKFRYQLQAAPGTPSAPARP